MNEAEKFSMKWDGISIDNKYATYFKSDTMYKFAQAYADEQLKKKMPSKQKISKTANTYGIYSMEVEAFVDGIRWLKQQILKP